MESWGVEAVCRQRVDSNRLEIIISLDLCAHGSLLNIGKHESCQWLDEGVEHSSEQSPDIGKHIRETLVAFPLKPTAKQIHSQAHFTDAGCRMPDAGLDGR